MEQSQIIILPIQAPVTKAAAEEMRKKIGAKGYFETSAKENQGVKELLEEAIRLSCAGDLKGSKNDSSGCCVIG